MQMLIEPFLRPRPQQSRQMAGVSLPVKEGLGLGNSRDTVSDRTVFLCLVAAEWDSSANLTQRHFQGTLSLSDGLGLPFPYR